MYLHTHQCFVGIWSQTRTPVQCVECFLSCLCSLFPIPFAFRFFPHPAAIVCNDTAQDVAMRLPGTEFDAKSIHYMMNSAIHGSSSRCITDILLFNYCVPCTPFFSISPGLFTLRPNVRSMCLSRRCSNCSQFQRYCIAYAVFFIRQCCWRALMN